MSVQVLLNRPDGSPWCDLLEVGVSGVKSALVGRRGLVFVTAGTIALYGAYRLYRRRGDAPLPSEGKAVFITGCDSGFGLALAKRLHCLGYHVIAGCLSQTSDGATALQALDRVDTVACDVTSDADMDRVREFIQDILNKENLVLWALVNNAGMMELNYFELMPVDSFRRTYEVNALGQVRVIKSLLPLVRQARGRVVNMASFLANVSPPGLSAYCMSKYAVKAMSQGLQLELEQFGVHVSIIMPLAYSTPLTEGDRVRQTGFRQLKQQDESVQAVYGGEEGMSGFYDQFYQKARVRQDHREVVDGMTHAVTACRPRQLYDCSWAASYFRIKIHYNLPSIAALVLSQFV